ncbi:MAG: alpha/beta hydrolase [Pseudomonadota bacterium]
MPLPLWLVTPALRLLVRLPLRLIASPQRLRAKFERAARLWFRMPDGAHAAEDRLPGPAGPIRVLWVSLGRPDRHRVILYLHGGAYVMGSPETHRHLAAHLAGAAGVRVLLPAYRLAPEHPFPAGLEDALACYRHLLRTHAPGQIALAGDSAGGGLAFGLLHAIEAADLPPPAAAVGFSPFTDMTLSGESHRRNLRWDAMLPGQRAREVVAFYLAGQDPRDPRASPMLGQLRAPPPSLIFASTYEILKDDALGLAGSLRAAGGDVRLELWPRLPHAWPVLTRLLAASPKAVAEAGRFISQAMERAARLS